MHLSLVMLMKQTCQIVEVVLESHLINNEIFGDFLGTLFFHR